MLANNQLFVKTISMDKDPKPTESIEKIKPDVLDDKHFISAVHGAEISLNDTVRSKLRQQALVDVAAHSLNEHFGIEYIDDLASIIGYGYVADADGHLIRDEDGKAEPVVIESAEATYRGIEIINILSQDKDTEWYRVFCKFKEAAPEGDERLLYIAPEDILEFLSDVSYDSETLKDLLMDFADTAESVTRQRAFTAASGPRQHQILRELEEEIEQYLCETYDDETICISASEYFIVSVTKKGKLEIKIVDQYNLPPDSWSYPVGKIQGCEFIESITTPDTMKLKALMRPYPGIVLSNPDIENSFYYIPIRAFNFADVIEDDNR